MASPKNPKHWIMSKGNLLGLLVAVGLALPQLTWCQLSELRPSWRAQSAEQWQPNLSLLEDRKRVEAEHPLNTLLQQADSHELQVEYGVAMREFEWKERANTADLKARADQAGRLKALSKKVVGRVQSRQREKTLQEAQKGLQTVEGLRAPLTVAVAIAAITSGRTLSTSLGSDTQLRAFSNLPHGTNFFEIASPLVTGSVTMNLGSSSMASLVDGPPKWVVRDERYSFNLSRQLPLWDLGTGLAYGTSSDSVTASVSKQLTEYLACEVDSRMPVSHASAMKSSEESVKVKYEMRF
ncbi:MAG: hypothetical protein NDJ90_12475 [Oligoflexia bacterium]|nr:hypothetical protein [Oligoflexia bacterium]